MTGELIATYTNLFRGRGDAYGTWEGGSIRETLTRQHFANHLQSSVSADWIGVYPHLGNAMDQHVTWGCVDIDGKDFDHDWDRMWELADTLVAVLFVKDIEAWREKTTNGIHIWVFPEGGHCPSRWMRRSLMAACKAVGYDPKEVNPKQEELLPGKLGNYVRLPYHGALAAADFTRSDRHFVFEDHETALTLQEFLELPLLTAQTALEATSQLWTPPVRVTFDGPPPKDVENILPLLSGLTYTIWKDGPLEGRDRSNTLAKLAYNLAEEGIQQPAGFAVVKDADRRWGKFADRPDCDEQIMRFVERAYS